MSSQKNKKAIIIGAGPAGLTAGLELLRTKKFSVDVIEKEKVVGGLARTTEYKGCRFDIGPHHFITDSPKIEQWWKDVMGDDFIKHKRFTRIYYNNHFFHYPLDPINVIKGLNFLECVKCILSYIKIRLFPIKNVKSFQDWVTNRFGYRLFSIFFKTYTEKVWGIACHKISADWASQRIKGFSLSKAIFYAFFGRFFTKNKPRTINDAFYYPSQGSGALWNRVADALTSFEQGTISLDEEVVYIEHTGQKILAIATRKTQGVPVKGAVQRLMRYEGDYFLSTMPLRGLIMSLNPLPPGEVVDAASALQYRGLITVNLIINKTQICPDHWLYVHEKKVRMGRVGNMNNFSLKMVDHPTHTALSLEYFAFVDEPFWFKSDAELIEIGKRELEMIGLVKVAAVVDGMVMRTPQAYPVYDENYKQHLGCVLDYLAKFENLHLMGRNGLHRYNNMDIAMLSAMGVVATIMDQENVVEPVKQEKSVQKQQL